MKRILFFALVAILFAACSEKEDGFTIKVKLEGAEGQIMLGENVGGSLVGVDTAEFVKGIATLKGAVEYPHEYYLMMVGGRSNALIFIENTKMEVTGKVDSLSFIKVTGSATHDEYQQLKDKISDIQEEYMSMYMDAQSAFSSGDSVKGNELLQKVEETYKTIDGVQVDFVKNNPSSYFGPIVLQGIQNS